MPLATIALKKWKPRGEDLTQASQQGDARCTYRGPSRLRPAAEQLVGRLHHVVTVSQAVLRHAESVYGRMPAAPKQPDGDTAHPTHTARQRHC